jgi:hypothetical protein
MEVSGHLNAPGALPLGQVPLVPTEEGVEQAPEPLWVVWGREISPASAGNHTMIPQLSKVSGSNEIP